jgi:hypothetical protein
MRVLPWRALDRLLMIDHITCPCMSSITNNACRTPAMNAPTTSTHVHAHAACAMRGDRDGMAVGGAAEEAEKGGDRRRG